MFETNPIYLIKRKVKYTSLISREHARITCHLKASQLLLKESFKMVEWSISASGRAHSANFSDTKNTEKGADLQT